MKTPFFNRPVTGFILSIIFTIATSALSYFSVEKFYNSEKWVDHTNTVRGKLESIISSMKDAETGQRGFLLTGNEKFLEPYKGAAQLTRAAFDTVKYLTKDNAAQQNEFKGLKEMIDSKYDLLENTINQKRLGGTISQDVLLMGKSYMDRARTIITRMESREEILLSTRLSTLNLYGTISLTSIIIAFLVSLVSTIYFYRRTMSDFEDRIRLEEQVKQETLAMEKKITTLKNLSERIGKGEYGIRVDPEELK
ncbi:CHASE3 domain-containing protein [Pedobacter miscanthi]|jgi:CHASE3 domain sensor protein|uniref:CHASE3 domain-containing protein n=1 Tax=Pedobacter miscanthi TaxID=2259170 RepID=UPI0029307299|nr:CHASE3 domain-containing protein [Pedobacter miscanthi]